MDIKVLAGFLLTILAINWVKNAFLNSSIFRMDIGGSLLYQSQAFFDRVSGKARHATSSSVPGNSR
jgi:hypothetical protein